MLGDFVGGQRLLDIGFHQQHRLGQLRMAGAQAVLQRNTLAFATFADALDHQFLGHRASQLRTVIPGQYRQQQVQHRHAATGGQPIAIPVEQVAGGDDLGKTLGEIVLPAPVHRCPIAIQQPQLGQRIDPGRQPADHTTGAHQLLERGAQRRTHRRRRFIGQQEQFLAPLQLARPRLARQLPGTFHGRLGLEESQLIDHFRMDPLGDAQGLLGQRQRQGFSAGPNQETNSMGSHGGRSETKNSRRSQRRQHQVRPSGAGRSA